MELELLRYNTTDDETHGILFEIDESVRTFLCYTLEDEHRDEKVPAETRIPPGRYEIQLRTEGGFHARYSRKFPGLHRGMLWLRGVPGFEHILIHVGNTDEDSAGCILVGESAQPGSIGSSVRAYRDIYPPIARELEAGRLVFITILDYDTPV